MFLEPYPTGPVEAIKVNRLVRDLRQGPVRFSNGDATLKPLDEDFLRWAETTEEVSKIAG